MSESPTQDEANNWCEWLKKEDEGGRWSMPGDLKKCADVLAAAYRNLSERKGLALPAPLPSEPPKACPDCVGLREAVEYILSCDDDLIRWFWKNEPGMMERLSARLHDLSHPASKSAEEKR